MCLITDIVFYRFHDTELKPKSSAIWLVKIEDPLNDPGVAIDVVAFKYKTNFGYTPCLFFTDARYVMNGEVLDNGYTKQMDNISLDIDSRKLINLLGEHL